MELSNTPAVPLASEYTESHGAATGHPERALWLTVLVQAAADLRDPNKRIRADAHAFFQGPDLLRILDLAGISRDEAP